MTLTLKGWGLLFFQAFWNICSSLICTGHWWREWCLGLGKEHHKTFFEMAAYPKTCFSEQCLVDDTPFHVPKLDQIIIDLQ